MWWTIIQYILQALISMLNKRPSSDFGTEEVIANEIKPETPDEPVVSSASEIKVIDVVAKLPWHNSRRWQERDIKTINTIIVHQAASTGTMETINAYHITPSKDNHISIAGAPHICYHYVIDKLGVIYKTNYLKHITWHCSGQNTSSIGILILGEFSGPSFTGSQTPSQAQLESLKSLLDAFTDDDYEDYTNGVTVSKANIFGHRDFGKANCPGNVLYSFVKSYKMETI